MVAAKDLTGLDLKGLTSDSRKVEPGYLFAALAGTKTDGARFLKDAMAKGARVVLGRPELADEVEGLDLVFIGDENPRLRLARIAAEFYGAQPETVAAVTGTKGKSSIVAFLRQIWTHLGRKAASLGTVGVVTPKGEFPLDNTTPDPVEIHRLLAELKNDGVEYLAIEASSHGLDQYRLDGVFIRGAAFTNLTRDHLDYHRTFDDYLKAKLRLFTEVVAEDGVGVINSDSEHSDAFVEAALKRGLTLITVGEAGETIKLLSRQSKGEAQALTISHCGKIYPVLLPLAGAFQASNALVAAGLAIGLGEDAAKVFAALPHLKGAPGRMEKVAFAVSGAPVYVDYAHSPDALEKVLKALRPHTDNKLHVMFGCGGDRDKGKRPLMGQIAAALADDVIVTDDNPRSEDAALIRKEILTAAPSAREIGDRGQAIRAAIASLQAGDVLVLAGKGHETGQYVKDKVLPFSDREEAVKVALSLGGRAA
ncbi:MAG TPA: UDP-N-acetylmuramoyl-L-alanyl-D-glutamate--2,6-diaminopimelate ligase [Rhizomicrobium sp.]|nr:UDP-N-acetylmuramoyl-L-alanyl-D-glutamate--2,6-diaminopimelate ligase [Rhizomicrobium sp.]